MFSVQCQLLQYNYDCFICHAKKNSVYWAKNQVSCDKDHSATCHTYVVVSSVCRATIRTSYSVSRNDYQLGLATSLVHLEYSRPLKIHDDRIFTLYLCCPVLISTKTFWWEGLIKRDVFTSVADSLRPKLQKDNSRSHLVPFFHLTSKLYPLWYMYRSACQYIRRETEVSITPTQPTDRRGYNIQDSQCALCCTPLLLPVLSVA